MKKIKISKNKAKPKYVETRNLNGIYSKVIDYELGCGRLLLGANRNLVPSKSIGTTKDVLHTSSSAVHLYNWFMVGETIR